MTDINVRIDCADVRGPLPPIWRSLGYDEINWTYTRRGQQAFEEIGRLSSEPYFIRCHNTFTSGNALSIPTKGSTNVVVEVQNGELRLDFSLLDRVFETFLQNNCKPIVELGFMPDALSKGPRPGPIYSYAGTDLWRYPPKDHNLWRDLVHATVKHCVTKFGEAEVADWYWELWNEPDNPGFFAGSVKDYCKMYDFTVDGAVAASDRIRIGGPGLATDPKFLAKFLRHCQRGKNAATGGRGARLDFVSVHAKGTDWPLKDQPFVMPSLAKILSHLADYERVLSGFPEFRKLPLLLDECDMAVATNFGVHDFPEFEFNNSEYFPVFVARMAKHIWDFLAETSLDIRLFTTWAFYFEGKRFFEGNRALFTNENVRKPVFNAFAMFEKLGAVRLGLRLDFAKHDDGNALEVDALATTGKDGETAVLVWNFAERGSCSDRRARLLLSGLNPDTSRFAMEHWRIDGTTSNAWSTWKNMGSPENPSSEQIVSMKANHGLELSQGRTHVEIESGELVVDLQLPGQSVTLVKLSPQ